MIELGISGIRPEKRQSGGSFSDAVVRLLESQAAGTADSSSTAAVEAASGLLSRSMSAAEISGPDWAVKAITPTFLGQCGRDLVRHGQSLHVITVSPMGKLSLLPCSSWHFEGDADPETWTVRATVYGPSTSTTRHLPYSGVIFLKWGARAGAPYTGISPLSWAATTARLQSETERSLADESGNSPVAHLIPIPGDGGDGGENDPLKLLKADIRKARGVALLVETTAAGNGEGTSAAPRKDWVAERLGPNPPASMEAIMGRSFSQMLSACGIPPSLFTEKAAGTAMREAYRQTYSATIEPLGKLVEQELSEKLLVEVKLSWASRHSADLSGRARAFQSMVGGGMDVSKAAGLAGLMQEE